jgi:enhancer of polycomb-like protein
MASMSHLIAHVLLVLAGPSIDEATMATKLNFRARTLDASKPMSLFLAEELPELADLNAINRSVPAMPSGMEKEEEAEKHLQDILENQERSGQKEELVIPTPEVFVATDEDGNYEKLYNRSQFKLPRQYIHVQPFSADQACPT